MNEINVNNRSLRKNCGMYTLVIYLWTIFLSLVIMIVNIDLIKNIEKL